MPESNSSTSIHLYRNDKALDEPSWYVVAATETTDPEKWIAYAQDRKAEDSRYSVVAFRRDIEFARFTQGVTDAKDARGSEVELPDFESGACPWVKLLCTRSGKPIPFRSCTECEFKSQGLPQQDQNSEEN